MKANSQSSEEERSRQDEYTNTVVYFPVHLLVHFSSAEATLQGLQCLDQLIYLRKGIAGEQDDSSGSKGWGGVECCLSAKLHPLRSPSGSSSVPDQQFWRQHRLNKETSNICRSFAFQQLSNQASDFPDNNMYTLEKWKEKSNLIREVVRYFSGGNSYISQISSVLYSYTELVQSVLMEEMASVDPLTLELQSVTDRHVTYSPLLLKVLAMLRFNG